MKYIYGQDGERIPDSIITEFELGLINPDDIRYQNKQALFNFVGAYINKDTVLVVFPKHTFSFKNSVNPSKKDINLLFNTIVKYLLSSSRTQKFSDSVGNEDMIDSTFPFYAVWEVFKYYRNYGLYKDRETIISPKDGNKIYWKKIIDKSQPYITKNGVIFSPLYRLKFNDKKNFISEAMLYVMNYAIRLLPFVFSNERVPSDDTLDKHIFSNSLFIENKLRSILSTTFKDIDRKLLFNLIDFFRSRNKSSDNDHIKIKYFNMIWQAMTEKYLNEYFDSIADGKPVFSSIKLRNERERYFKETTVNIDESSNGWNIRMDHYHIDKDYQLIFDSKYYDDESDLNYKQVTYHNEMVKKYRDTNYPFNNYIQTVSALFFPGNNPMKEHYRTNHRYMLLDYNGDPIIKSDEVIIWLIYLDVRKVMEVYLDS